MQASTISLPTRARVTPTFDIPGLVWTLTRTDFKTRYHGTLGGFAWALLKPLAMFAVLYGVFSFVFASDASYTLNLVLGIFLFEFFSEGTKTGVTSLLSKGFLLTKSRFPSWILVATSISNALITLAVFSVVYLVVLTVLGHAPRPLHVALYVLYLVCFTVMILGISLGTSALFLRYRDLNQVWDMIIQAGFFLAPIVYPLRVIPWRFQFAVYLWMPTPIIQFSRMVLVDGTVPSLRAHLLMFLMTAMILGGGLSIFRRYAPRAAEYL